MIPFLGDLGCLACMANANTASSERTKRPLVCVRPDVTLDGVMYTRAMVDPSKSSVRAPTYKIDVGAF